MLKVNSSKILKITGYLTGNCSEQERRDIENWIQKSESNRKLFAQMKFTWEHSENQPIYQDADLQAALNAVNSNIRKVSSHTPACKRAGKRFHRAGMLLMKAAAVIVFLLGIFWILQQQNRTAPENIIVETLIPKELTTPDGSQIKLNQGSVLQYPATFTDNHRKVVLKGEAYFNIVYQSDRPFLISVGDLLITVKGTAFFVRAYEHSPTVEVAVESGIVLVSTLNRETGAVREQIMLHENEKANFIKETGLLVKSTITDQNHKGWISRKLEFDNTPLTRVLQLLESTYGLSFAVEIPVGHLLLSARFDNEDPEDILKALRMIYGFNISKDGSHVRIY